MIFKLHYGHGFLMEITINKVCRTVTQNVGKQDFVTKVMVLLFCTSDVSI